MNITLRSLAYLLFPRCPAFFQGRNHYRFLGLETYEVELWDPGRDMAALQKLLLYALVRQVPCSFPLRIPLARRHEAFRDRRAWRS